MKASIVMPVYNGSNYIRRSLESVFDQNSRGLEIIVVDDGSTDETASIVRSLFQEKKSQEIRCRLVYQKNQGVSVARNVGLKNASGDYVFFLDADDLINPDCIGKLYKRAMDTAAEISMCGFNMTSSDGKILRAYQDSYHFFNSTMFGKDAALSMLKERIRLCTGNGMFSRRFLISTNLSYSRGATHGEDQEFVLKALFLSNKVSCVSESLVQYVQHSASIVREKTLKQFHYVGSMKRLLRFFETHGAEEEIVDLMVKNKIPESYLTVLSSLYANNYSRKDFRQIINHPFVKRQIESYKAGGDSAKSKIKTFIIRRFPYLYFWYHKLNENRYLRTST